MKASKTSYHTNGKIKEELWLNEKGELHRENDLPALIEYDKKGSISFQSWYKKGKKYRENDQPFEIRYYANNQIMFQSWYTNEKLFRNNDLPGYIEYDTNGNVTIQQWFKEDKIHRLYAPAFILLNSEFWHINGNNITEKVNEWIKENNFPKWQEWNDNHKLLFKLTFDK